MDNYSGWIGVLQTHTEASIMSTNPEVLAKQIVGAMSESDYLSMNDKSKYTALAGVLNNFFTIMPEEIALSVLSEIEKLTKGQDILYNHVKSIYDYVSERDSM